MYAVGNGVPYTGGTIHIETSGNFIATMLNGVQVNGSLNLNAATMEGSFSYTDAEDSASGTWDAVIQAKRLWTQSVGTSLPSVAAVAPNGTIYVTANQSDGSTLLVSLKSDGSQNWIYSLGEWTITSPAIGEDGTVYVAHPGSTDPVWFTPIHTLSAIRPDGSLKWIFDLGSSPGSSPAIDANGNLYVSSGSRLFSLTPDGIVRWIFSPLHLSAHFKTPVISADGTVYVGTNSTFDDTPGNEGNLVGYLYAVNPDGNQYWRFIAVDAIDGGVVIGSDGAVYFGTGNMFNRAYAVNPIGTQKWVISMSFGMSMNTSPVIGNDGTIYWTSRNGKLVALNSDGSEQWSTVLDSWLDSFSPVVSADEKVFVGDGSGFLHVVDANGRAQQVFGSQVDLIRSPVIAPDGILYVGSADGLHALDIQANGAANSAWPMVGHDIRNTGQGTNDVPDYDGDGISDKVDPDDDNDGMPDDYEEAKRFNPLNPDDAQQDADNDGELNLTEYRNGTDPHDPGSSMHSRGAVISIINLLTE